MLHSFSSAAALLGYLVPKPKVWGWAECVTEGRLQVRAGRLMSECVLQQQHNHRLRGKGVSNRRSAAQQHYPLPGLLTEKFIFICSAPSLSGACHLLTYGASR